MTATPRYGLIQLAGRQILPNLWLALTLQRHGMLVRHEVIHSAEKRESADPAQQLIRLVGEGDGADGSHDVSADVVVHVLNEAEPTMWHTRQTARAIIDDAETAGVQTSGWILHATGGNKPMSTALTQLAGDTRVQAVVYRNIDGSWWVVERDRDGELTDRRLGEVTARGQAVAAWERALSEAPVRLDAVPLESLLQAQFDELREGNAVRGNPTQAQPVPLDAWLRSAVRPRAGFADHWRGLHPTLPTISDGDAFESFVAHILAAAGVRRVLWGVEVFSRSGTPIVETDVVACWEDRLAFYDVKIDKPDSPNKTAQIRTAHDTARTFGGLSAQAVMVRPNWPLSTAIEEFAQALGVKLITSIAVPRLAEEVLQPLGLEDCRATEIEHLRRALRALKLPPHQGPAQAVFQHRRC